VQVYRDIGRASDEELDEIRLIVTRLLDGSGRFLGGDLMEALCVLREAAAKTKRRRADGNAAQVDAVRPTGAAGLRRLYPA
jgi:hypothetical protein